MTGLRQMSWKKIFVGALALAFVIFVSYQLRLNEREKFDSISQLELRVDSLFKWLRRLEDVIAIQGYSRDPVKETLGEARRQRRLIRDFHWLKFLRKCEDRKTLRLLLLKESLVRNADATNAFSTETLLNNVSHLGVFDDDVADFIDVVLGSMDVSSTTTPMLLPTHAATNPFPVDLILADSARGSLEKIPLTNGSSAYVRRATGTAKSSSKPILLGFSFYDGTDRRVNVSVIYKKLNAVVDVKYGGYYYLPWSWTGFPRAFPPFSTKRVDVEGFAGDLFQSPRNLSHYLWQSAASDFISCDAERNAAFAKKSLKPTSLDPVKDKARILAEMALITALQSSMATWEKRNWIFAGTLLGWYRQCSLIPHDLDMDTASWIHDFEDWMIEHYRKHPLLKLYVKFGLKDDSLEFKMGDKKKRTIDLFWMYPGPAKNQSWLGIQTFDGRFTKKISFYPPITKICSADLHGYLVYVPCDTWSIIKIEYGVKNWFEPNPKYDYKNDAFNWRINGSWTAKQWRSGTVYKVFQ